MSPMYLGHSHDVEGVEVLVCVSCDVYIVLDGLGRSGKPSHPPVAFCLCRRNDSSLFRLCLLLCLRPSSSASASSEARHLCFPFVHPPLFQRGVAVRGSRRGSRVGSLKVSSPTFRRFFGGRGMGRRHVSLGFCGLGLFGCFLPPGGGGSGVIALTGVACGR